MRLFMLYLYGGYKQKTPEGKIISFDRCLGVFSSMSRIQLRVSTMLSLQGIDAREYHFALCPEFNDDNAFTDEGCEEIVRIANNDFFSLTSEHIDELMTGYKGNYICFAHTKDIPEFKYYATKEMNKEYPQFPDDELINTSFAVVVRTVNPYWD